MKREWMKKGIAIAVAAVVLMWVAASIRSLDTEVSGLFGIKYRLDQAEKELHEAKAQLSMLKSQYESAVVRIKYLEETELKRTMAVCKTFPHAKGCSEFWDLLSGNVDLGAKAPVTR